MEEITPQQKLLAGGAVLALCIAGYFVFAEMNPRRNVRYTESEGADAVAPDIKGGRPGKVGKSMQIPSPK